MNSMYAEMKEDLLSEIQRIAAKLKEGKMSSWYIIQLLLDKLNGMANVLKNGLGAYQQAIEKVSGDYQKMLAAMKRIEADQAQKKSVTADTKALADAFKKLQKDLYGGTKGTGTETDPGKGSLLYIANHSNNPDWKQTAADAQGTYDMIANEKSGFHHCCTDGCSRTSLYSSSSSFYKLGNTV